MISKKNLLKVAAVLAVAVLPLVAIEETIAAKKVVVPAAPTAVGSWFGIARPCPADPQADSPTHAAFCQAVCGTCSSIPGTLPPEVPMMPTLLADGTVIADDAGEIASYHTTATGNWAASSNDGLPDLPGQSRFRATFFWLGSTQKPNDDGTCCFSNSVRPRFITYFDPNDPDRMWGFIQPYAALPMVSTKSGYPLVLTNPFSALDPKAGNHVPVPSADLLTGFQGTATSTVGPLPAGCQNNLGCLGTYHFVIRRIKDR